ncbi:MAG: rhomboid family intramembrane serine protease [Betaproteobacteria bacterium]
MQIHLPDPAYTGSPRVRVGFRVAVEIAVALVALLWLVLAFNWALDLDLQRYGVRPRELRGLTGIVAAPLLHANFAHLFANSLPLLVLGSMLMHLYPTAALPVFGAVYVGPGIAVWLFGRDSVHIGASGIAYGLVAYILVAGLLRRDRRAIAASLLVCFMYGALVWGVLPIEPGASWETHLAGALIGVACALAYRHRDVPPRARYSWEVEAPANEPSGGELPTQLDAISANGATRPLSAPETADGRDWIR